MVRSAQRLTTPLHIAKSSNTCARPAGAVRYCRVWHDAHRRANSRRQRLHDFANLGGLARGRVTEVGAVILSIRVDRASLTRLPYIGHSFLHGRWALGAALP
jgi:hypothetical protein